MGNMSGAQRAEGDGGRGDRSPAAGSEGTIVRRWPSMSLTWEDFQTRRLTAADEVGNGLTFPGDVVVPETVLELILSMVEPQDILNCNLVSALGLTRS
jgi:hypothetical protein